MRTEAHRVTLSAKVTKAEKQLVLAVAAESGKTLSEVVRELAVAGARARLFPDSRDASADKRQST